MSSTPEPQDDATSVTPTTRSPLTDRWWWSSVLWMIVGVGVIIYQSGPIRSGAAIALTWVMVAVGALVAVRGLLMLRTAWGAEQDRRRSSASTDRA